MGAEAPGALAARSRCLEADARTSRGRARPLRVVRLRLQRLGDGGARLCRAGAGAGEDRATEKEGFEPSMEEFTPITP